MIRVGIYKLPDGRELSIFDAMQVDRILTSIMSRIHRDHRIVVRTTIRGSEGQAYRWYRIVVRASGAQRNGAGIGVCGPDVRVWVVSRIVCNIPMTGS